MSQRGKKKRELLYLRQTLATGILCPFEFPSGRGCQLEAGHEKREPHKFEYGVAEQLPGKPLRLLELAIELAYADKPAKKPRRRKTASSGAVAPTAVGQASSEIPTARFGRGHDRAAPIAWVRGVPMLRVERGEAPTHAQKSAQKSPIERMIDEADRRQWVGEGGDQIP